MQPINNTLNFLNQYNFNLPYCWSINNPDIQKLMSGNINRLPTKVSFEDSEEACNVPFNEILPGLYLGSEYGAGRILGRKSEEATYLKKMQLFEKGINTIVCCTESSLHYFSTNEFNYIDIPLIDSDVKLEDSLPRGVLETIDQRIKQGGGVFIHCAAGISRSVSIMTLYISYKFPHLSYDQILNFLKEKRPCVQPNEHFQKQLQEMIHNRF